MAKSIRYWINAVAAAARRALVRLQGRAQRAGNKGKVEKLAAAADRAQDRAAVDRARVAEKRAGPLRNQKRFPVLG